MAVTKNYIARIHGARDLVIGARDLVMESVGLIARILAVALVLLFFAGALDLGPGIKITQPAAQSANR
jgi:hypothetical protein